MPNIRLYEYTDEISDLTIGGILDGARIEGKRLHTIKSREFELIDHIIENWKERYVSENPDVECDIYTAPDDEGNHLLAVIY